jgi:hypothetical protein
MSGYASRKCLSTKTATGDPCQHDVDWRRDRCESGHRCTTRAVVESNRASDVAALNLGTADIDDVVTSRDRNPRTPLVMSPSAADDGGLIAIVDATSAAQRAGTTEYRLFGGIAVMLHIQRLGLDLPLRETGDADFGVPPYVLRDGSLARELEAVGYGRTYSNRWERAIDETRLAAVDLLVPSYTSRPRHTKRYGDVVTTEVPGLNFALSRPPVVVTARFALSRGEVLAAGVQLPDALSTLVLKLGARRVRDEARDATDLWRCLEIAVADGVSPEDLPNIPVIGDVATALYRELGRDGRAVRAITEGLTAEAASQRVTRIQALLLRLTGRE